MIKLVSLAALLAALVCGSAVAQDESDLPFKRTIGIAGSVTGSLGESGLAAGVPAGAMFEVLHAMAANIDIDHDIHDGDRFYVRFQRTFSLDGTPTDGGTVLWAELQLAGKKTTVAIHRFRPLNASSDSFWLVGGQSAAAPELRLPVSNYVVSSGFGLRVDPLDQPSTMALGSGPVVGQAIGQAMMGKGAAEGGLPPALGVAGARANQPTSLGLAMGLAPTSSTPRPIATTRGLSGFRGTMALHEGVDLVAAYGTPILAAGDGVVKGAEPKGRYGNWIQIDHEGELSTVYGHLSSFAPGIEPGTRVSQGDVIGFIGLTGRTTGPHVHFEVRFKGRPVNPMVYSALKRTQLRGVDLDHFRKLVAHNIADRDREAKVASAGF
jgi:murein DD-endopeptidase MepM/ murein hydrolase activator NlpD